MNESREKKNANLCTGISHARTLSVCARNIVIIKFERRENLVTCSDSIVFFFFSDLPGDETYASRIRVPTENPTSDQ